ncbi:MAG: hypothetical protein Q8K71_17560 [Polaromonas sp.]|nr:hypothetical protein [Polaromonas sp.]MDP3752145.1 hypothetical protein [Polaromonas sp.]
MFVELVRMGELANHVLESHLLLVLAPHLREVEQRIDRKANFNLTQALVLLAIWNPESNHVYPVSVARQLGIERTRVSHQIALLHDFGWIRHRPGSEKKHDLEVTAVGLPVAKEIESSLRFIEGRLRKGIAKTFDHLRSGVLEEVAEQIEKLASPPPRGFKRPTY